MAAGARVGSRGARTSAPDAVRSGVAPALSFTSSSARDGACSARGGGNKGTSGTAAAVPQPTRPHRTSASVRCRFWGGSSGCCNASISDATQTMSARAAKCPCAPWSEGASIRPTRASGIPGASPPSRRGVARRTAGGASGACSSGEPCVVRRRRGTRRRAWRTCCARCVLVFGGVTSQQCHRLRGRWRGSSAVHGGLSPAPAPVQPRCCHASLTVAHLPGRAALWRVPSRVTPACVQAMSAAAAAAPAATSAVDRATSLIQPCLDKIIAVRACAPR